MVQISSNGETMKSLIIPSVKLTFAHTIYDQGIKNAMTQYSCCPGLPYKHAE